MIGLAGLLVGCGESGDDGCTSNTDCPTGQYCGAAGSCTFDCTTDTDCAAGTCNSIGKCVPLPPDSGSPVKFDGGPIWPDWGTPPPSCGPSNCTGCCKANKCELGGSGNACGKGGVACKQCAVGTYCYKGDCSLTNCVTHAECAGDSVCASGVCVPAFGRKYRVTVVSAKINLYDYSTTPTGESWDEFGGLPDPNAVTSIGGTAASQTSAKADTITPSWNEYADLTINQWAAFRIDVWDEDLLASDWIGAFEWKQGLTIATLKAGGLTWNNPPDPKYGLQELVFTIKPL